MEVMYHDGGSVGQASGEGGVLDGSYRPESGRLFAGGAVQRHNRLLQDATRPLIVVRFTS